MASESASTLTPTDHAVTALSSRLRAETLAEHEHAERRPFIAQLMRGELTLGDYTRYLAQLSYVYEALEARTSRPGEPAALNDPRLHRSAAIANDLRALGVVDATAEHPPLAATLAYADRIRAAGEAHLFLAHHYTRYLGDLSGGQVVATMIARHYGATPEQLTFSRFEFIDKPVVFKREYREMLDRINLTDEQSDLLVEETKEAYRANSALFDALAR